MLALDTALWLAEIRLARPERSMDSTATCIKGYTQMHVINTQPKLVPIHGNIMLSAVTQPRVRIGVMPPPMLLPTIPLMPTPHRGVPPAPDPVGVLQGSQQCP